MFSFSNSKKPIFLSIFGLREMWNEGWLYLNNYYLEKLLKDIFFHQISIPNNEERHKESLRVDHAEIGKERASQHAKHKLETQYSNDSNNRHIREYLMQISN